MRPTWTVIAVFVLGAAAGAGGAAATSSDDEVSHQQAQLAARSVLPSATFRAGSPPSGAFFTPGNVTDAENNDVFRQTTASPAYFDSQPVQGVSALIPAAHGKWWALTDNGYGGRNTSADWQLGIYRMNLGLDAGMTPRVLETVLLSDPRKYVPWKTVCDPTVGTDLPPFSFNVLPTTKPAACGTDPAARLLTGFDFDPESIEIARDGTFWIGDEFGPFLLHADRHGRLLEPPIAAPGVKSPQNPTLNILKTPAEQPNVAASRGFEAMAIDPSRKHLYPMFEGPISGDDPQDLRILEFDLRTHRFTDHVRQVRLEMPGQQVNLSNLFYVDGTTHVYPDAPPPAAGESAAELTAVNSHQFLMVERDSNGDGLGAPRFKKIFLLDTAGAGNGGYVDKQLLADLLAVPDPADLVTGVDFFQFPFNTIESVHVVSPDTILTANDNNYPFSNGRSRSLTNARTGVAPPAPPFTADDNEFILIKLGQKLKVDSRILAP